jgi:plastocyanin
MLTKPEGSNNTFTAKFDQPGTYDYSCVHHGSLGMVGQVVVG